RGGDDAVGVGKDVEGEAIMGGLGAEAMVGEETTDL
nr:hypothetical protein [Tanacetum cinerariifolium]